MNKLSKLLVFASAVAMTVAFQNCSNGTSFDSSGSLVAKSGAENIDDTTDDIADGTTGDTNAGVGVPSNGDGVAPVVRCPTCPPVRNPPGAAPTPRPPVAGHDHDDDHDDDDGHHPGHSGGNCANHGSSNSGAGSGSGGSGERGYVCVLEGPGQSVKAALSRGGLSGGNSSAAVACMSKRACEEIVSQRFQVKSAERRGVCNENGQHAPDVASLSDDDVKQAVVRTEMADHMSKLMNR